MIKISIKEIRAKNPHISFLHSIIFPPSVFGVGSKLETNNQKLTSKKILKIPENDIKIIASKKFGKELRKHTIPVSLMVDSFLLIPHLPKAYGNKTKEPTATNLKPKNAKRIPSNIPMGQISK